MKSSTFCRLCLIAGSLAGVFGLNSGLPTRAAESTEESPPVLLRWKLQPGEELRYSLQQTDVGLSSFGSMHEEATEEGRRVMSVDMSWHVDEVQSEKVDLSMQVRRLRFCMEQLEGTTNEPGDASKSLSVRFDSQTEDFKLRLDPSKRHEPLLIPQNQAGNALQDYARLCGQKSRFTLSPRGDVLQAELPQGLKRRFQLGEGGEQRFLALQFDPLARLTSCFTQGDFASVALGSFVPPGLQVTTNRGPTAFSQISSLLFGCLPSHAVRIGDRWERETSMETMLFNATTTSHFTYQGLVEMDGRAIDKISMEMELHLTPSQMVANASPGAQLGEYWKKFNQFVTFQLNGTWCFDRDRGRTVEMMIDVNTQFRVDPQEYSGAYASVMANQERQSRHRIHIAEGASGEEELKMPAYLSENRPQLVDLRTQLKTRYEEQFQAGQYGQAAKTADELFRLHQRFIHWTRQGNRDNGDGIPANHFLSQGSEFLEGLDWAAQALMMRGDAEAKMSRFAEAERSYLDAEQGLRSLRGWWSPELAATYQRLADLSAEQEHWAKALEYQERSANIRETLLKPTGELGLRFHVVMDETSGAAGRRPFGFLRISEVAPGSAAATTLGLKVGNTIDFIQADGGVLLNCGGEVRGNEAAECLNSLLSGPAGTKVAVRAHYGRNAASEFQWLERAAREDHEPPSEAAVSNLVSCLLRMASLCRHAGDLKRARSSLLRAADLADSVDNLDGGSAATRYELACVLQEEGRSEKAEQLFRECAEQLKEETQDRELYACVLASWATLDQQAGNTEKAVQRIRKAASIRTELFGSKHPETVATHWQLARFLLESKAANEASRVLEATLDEIDDSAGSFTLKAKCLQTLAEAKWALQERDAAIDLLRQAMNQAELQRGATKGGDSVRVSLFGRFAGAYERMVEWQIARQQPAEAYEAIERSRARSLIDHLQWYGVDLLQSVDDSNLNVMRLLGGEEDPVLDSQAWQRTKQLEDTAQDTERYRQLYAQSPLRGRTEQEQLREEIAELRRGGRRHASYDDETRLQRLSIEYASMNLPKELRRDLFYLFRDEFSRLCDETMRIGRERRQSRPQYWEQIANNWHPLSMEEVVNLVRSSKALYVQYLVGSEGTYVLTVAPDGKTETQTLRIRDQEGSILGVPVGPLTREKLRTILLAPDCGVCRLLASPEKALEATSRLAALWSLLIPDHAKQLLRSGSPEEIIVIPDGLLSILPFEALVMNTAPSTEYLLDSGIPLSYCYSATLLQLLRDRPEATSLPGVESVLSVADPAYTNSTPGVEDGNDRNGTPATRYVLAGGSLAKLPFTAVESQWVADVFRDAGRQTESLLGNSATENAVRQRIAGRRYVHFACHGLVDESAGNRFAALAVTPGTSARLSRGTLRQRYESLISPRLFPHLDSAGLMPASLREEDAYGDEPGEVSRSECDGFITLDEICQLNLHGCELAILSACNTNFGPEQTGEGVWSLSRGFFVAGARRVVATNWSVDDEAASSLVSYFCSCLAQGEVFGDAPNYAKSLHRAKKWLRDQKEWESPSFWAPFVLMGPG